MKKVLIIVSGLALFGFVLWVLLADDGQVEQLEMADMENQEQATDDEPHQQLAENKTAPVPKGTPHKGSAKADPVFTKNLDNLIETNRKEVEECEIGVDRILGSSIEDENDQIYREENLVDTLEEFDRTNLVPKSSGKLLKMLADEKIKDLSPEELGAKLRDLRPCRPYKKMSFIHNLMTSAKNKKWDEETKQRALKSTCGYFKKELSDHTTISNLNMQAALLESMVTEGMLDKKHEDRVSEYKEELEDAYDELLDRADDIREEQEEKGTTPNFIPLEIIKAEFTLAEKFRGTFLGMVKDVGCPQ